MIFFEQNKNKIFALVVLTVFFMGFITWQWWQLKPWSGSFTPAKQNLDFSVASSTREEIKNSWEMGKIQIENLRQAFKRQQQEAEVLDATKQYLNNLSSSTPTTTAE